MTAFATSYIKTTTAAATRLADSASITGTNFSQWYNQTEGTFVVAVKTAPVNNVAQQAFYVSDGTTNENVFLRRNTSGVAAFALSDGGIAQGDIVISGTIAASATYKAACAYRLNDCAGSADGGAVAVDTLATIPTVSQMSIGANISGAQMLNGHIQRISYYRARLSNASLQSLST
jgi:hypothetical protein